MTNRGTTDPVALSQQAVATAPALQPQALELLMMCAAHNEQLYEDMVRIVRPDYFNSAELPVRMLFEAVCASVSQYRGVTYETLQAYFAQAISEARVPMFSEAQLEEIYRPNPSGLLWWVSNPLPGEVCDTNINYARQVLTRFAYERTVIGPLRNALNPAVHAGGSPADLGELLSAVAGQQARLSSLHTLPTVSVAPEFGTPLTAPNVFRPTGVRFIDAALEGQRDGDCNGLLGPTGGGKTTLAIQMAVAAAKQAWQDSVETGLPPRKAVFVTVEESARKVLPRVWSAFFSIDRRKLESLSDWGELTTQETLGEYERRMQTGDDVLSESERYMLYREQLASCFVLLDFSGSEEYPEAGNGYVPELVSCLDRLGGQPYSVFIDYAGLWCDRYLESLGGQDKDKSRMLLKSCGDACRKNISERFGCTTWLLHQLKGAVGEYPPTKLIRHSDAEGCRDFAVNLSVCACLGLADDRTGCRRMNFSKVRYRANEETPPATLRPDDKLAVLRDVTREYTVDAGSRKFLSAAESRTVHGGAELPRRSGPPAGLRPAGIRTDYTEDPTEEAST